jgi:hypothetical protein
MRGATAARAGLIVTEPAMIDYDGPSDMRELFKDANFRLRALVRVRDARTVRTRPRFARWSANVSASFLPSLLNRSEVLEYFRIAGALGIGDSTHPCENSFYVQPCSRKMRNSLLFLQLNFSHCRLLSTVQPEWPGFWALYRHAVGRRTANWPSTGNFEL